MNKTIEDFPRIKSWIDENTSRSEFSTHPDFVEDAMLELLNEIEQLKLETKNKWISVKDELPETGKYLVRVYREATVTSPHADFICSATLSLVSRHCGDNSPLDLRWYAYPSGRCEITQDVTHWMPLPGPPNDNT